MHQKPWTVDELTELESADTWDWDDAEVHEPVGERRAAVMVQLSPEEFRRLARQAKTAGTTVSAFVHAAVLRALGEPAPPGSQA